MRMMEPVVVVLFLTAVSVGAENLQAISVLDPPFLSEKAEAGKLNGNDKYEGFIKDLLEQVASRAEVSYTLTIQTDGKYGRPGGSSGAKWDGMIGAVLDNQADVIAAPLRETDKRKGVLAFSTPWMSHGLSVIMNRKDVFGEPGLPYNLAYFLTPFTVGVWLLIVVAAFGVSVLKTLFNLFDPYEYGKMTKRGALREGHEGSFDFKESLLFSFAAISFQGFYKPPLSIASRVMVIFWWFFCVVTVVTYIAAMVQTINKSGSLQIPKYSTFADLLSAPEEFRFGGVADAEYMDLFKKSRKTEFRMAWERMAKYNDSASNDLKTGIKRVKEGGYAFIGETPYLTYLASIDCDLITVGSDLNTRTYAFGLSKTSNLTGMLNDAIAELAKEGNINSLYEKWWNTGEGCRGARVQPGGSAGRETMYEGTGLPITLNEFGGPLIILLIGVFCSVIALVAEIVYYRLKGKRGGKRRNLIQSADSSIQRD